MEDDYYERIVKAILTTIAILIIASWLMGCKSVKYVTVPEYHSDTVLVNRTARDSIYMHDSIYVKEWQAGDTVYVHRDRWNTQWRERIVLDSIYISKTDSVPYPVEVPVEVPAQLTWWQRTKMYAGVVMLAAIGLISLIGLIRLLKKIGVI